MPRPKKKRKPKSQRGKNRKSSEQAGTSSALDEAMDIFGFPASEDPEPSEQNDTKDQSNDQ